MTNAWEQSDNEQYKELIKDDFVISCCNLDNYRCFRNAMPWWY